MSIKLRNEATLKNSVEFKGVGVHSGALVNLIIRSAPENFGIVFKRTDVIDKDPFIKLSPESVENPVLCTKVVNDSGVSVSVIEHLLAAFRISGITNALVEINFAEIPIMDGSSIIFVEAFRKTGIDYQNAKVPAILIKRPLISQNNTGEISILPSKHSRISVKLSYDRINPVIGSNNNYEFDIETNMIDIANARTFGWIEDCEKIKAAGMAKGASEENTVVIMQDHSIKNQGGLRNPKELVMHKCLDLLGDISVIGYDIIGSIQGFNTSHALNNILMRKLLNEIDEHEILGINELDNFHQLNLAAC